ncbi:MAG: hypothetical protein WA830_24275 [Candidatus Sulfotelmatobacter sp.]
MKLQTLERQIQKAARDLQLEISAMEPNVSTRHGEDRQSLIAELRLLETLLQTIEGWNLARARTVIERVSKAR